RPVGGNLEHQLALVAARALHPELLWPAGHGEDTRRPERGLKLGQPLYQGDYSAVISKYLVDTAKHMSRAFERAAHHGAALFLDETDSLLSKRVSLDESCATSINQNRNCLMQELRPLRGRGDHDHEPVRQLRRGPVAARVVEAELTLQFRTAHFTPEPEETIFEAGVGSLGSEAKPGHVPVAASISRRTDR
ncbi:MAG: AAA family ATPase, partial [Verrucomicrobiae bacterium]|nr:AAA family ATPase [Verrucomicrobiae bacterium]